MVKSGHAAQPRPRPPRPGPPGAAPAGPDLESRYRLLAENSRDMVGLIGYDGAWRYVSPASRHLLGLDPADLVGRDAYQLVHPDDRQALAVRLRRSIEGLAPPPGPPPEFRLRRRDGSWIWVEGTGSPVPRPDGGADYQVSLRDITDRRRALEAAQEAARHERSIYESIRDAYLQLDRDFRLVYMNRVAARMRTSSGPPEMVYGKVLWDAFPDLKGTKYEREYKRAMRDNVPVEVEDYYPRLQKWFEARAYPSRDGLSVYFHDVTERRRAADTERLAYQRSLEIASLKEINHYKTDFVNTAAHELGNPLTPIRIQLRVLRNAFDRGSRQDMQHAVETLERNVNRLVHLVEDILEGARLQASRLVVTPVRADLAPLLVESVESYRAAAQQAGIALRLEAPPQLKVRADPERIGQVMDNLLSNAVKYGGGTIEVHAAIEADAVHVWVADRGRGIPPEHLPHLFQPFSRIGAQQGPHGSGLGLYICAGIVKNHGGRIWCESRGNGQGSTFHFTLPLTLPPHADGS